MAKQKYKDPNGRHIRVYTSLLNSPAWRVLGYPARALFCDLREKYGGTNNGDISATLTDLKHKGWTSPATLSRALHELQAMGFLVQTRGGGVKFGSKVSALYRFTDLDCFAIPGKGIEAIKATHDYLRFKTVSDAEAAHHAALETMRAAERGRKTKAAEKKRTLREPHRHATGTVAITRFNSAGSVVEAA